MSVFKNKYFLPAALLGMLLGYSASEWVLPRYIQPSGETKMKAMEMMAVIGVNNPYARQTKSGDYLISQFAQNQKDWDKASSHLNKVLLKEDGNLDILKHAMVLSMVAGNVEEAVSIAKKVQKEEDDNLLATLFISVENFKQEEYETAINSLNKVSSQSSASFLMPILKLWASSNKQTFDLESLPPVSFYAYHVLLIGKYLDQKEKALNYAKQVFKIEDNDVRDLEEIADLFTDYGETKLSLAIYKAIKDNGFGSEKISDKINLIEKGKDVADLLEIPEIQSPKQGAAIVLMNMGMVLLREYSYDSATIFSRMSLYLNSSLDKNHIIIGAILGRHERYDAAIKFYNNIKPESSFYVDARQQIAELYAAQDEHKKAIESLQKLYQEKQDISALIQIGDIYRYQEDYQKAVEVYSGILKDYDEVPEKYWHVLYARGMAYERLKKFKKAEEDLKTALKFRPNHPYLLNYLGYSWADQGINLEESLEMISKALAAKPDDGYIADSLGWVYYKMGQYEEAVPYLERALELMPYDATLNDHMGDAYWQTGRKLEARFQWQRAANYSDEDEVELREKAKEKIANGLPVIEKKENKSLLSDLLPKDNGV